MIRLVIGSLLGGLAQFFVGFLFWGTPLAGIAFKVVGDAQNAAVQQSLAQNLSVTGTGTYYVPWPDTPAGSIMHGQGPVALIHFNINGFAVMNGSSLIGGLILSIVATFLLGLALFAVARHITDFATRARIVILVTVATVLYFTLALPVFNDSLPWPYFIYTAVSQLVGLIVAGLIVARWFLPKPGSVIQ